MTVGSADTDAGEELYGLYQSLGVAQQRAIMAIQYRGIYSMDFTSADREAAAIMGRIRNICDAPGRIEVIPNSEPTSAP